MSAPAYDLVIHGGEIATADARFRADIGVRGGKIVAIADRIDGGATREDATGKLVLPGGIEPHCHIAQESATGGMTADDYWTGSRSAAVGGNSCFIPFAAQHRGQGVTETLDRYDARAAPNSILDYGYHLIIADPSPEVLAEELPAAFARGVTSFKVFITYDAMRIDDRQFLDILTVAKTHGAVTMVHAENDGMVSWMRDRFVAAGHTAPKFHAPSRPALAEREAIHRAICLARLVDTPLVIVHVSTEEGAALVAEARAAGAPIFAETCPQYLFLAPKELDRPGLEGAKYMCSPPLREERHRTALWRRLIGGTFTLYATDHAPYRYDVEGKLANGPDAPFTKIANGMPGIALRLPLLFSEGVLKGRLSLERFVALASTNPARLYGIHPKKGAIAIGSDADIALWDPTLTRKVTLADQHDAMDYTPFEGMTLTGWPVAVWRRGDCVMRDGVPIGERGSGQFLARAPFDGTDHPGGVIPELDPARNFGADVAPRRGGGGAP